jgi:hypothetical protein
MAESAAWSSPVPSQPDPSSRIDFNICAINSDSNCPAAAAAFWFFGPGSAEPKSIAAAPVSPTLIV